MRKSFVLELSDGRKIHLGERTAIVGVLNVTPDSFSDGGQNYDSQRAISRALELEEEGADIIEVGGESTRPGAVRLTADEELSRIVPVLEGIRDRVTVPIAIDTYKSKVAAAAVSRGAAIINDVSALRFDPALADVAARERSLLVLMHMRGEPANMQKILPSPDIFAEINADLGAAVGLAESRGVRRDRM